MSESFSGSTPHNERKENTVPLDNEAEALVALDHVRKTLAAALRRVTDEFGDGSDVPVSGANTIAAKAIEDMLIVTADATDLLARIP